MKKITILQIGLVLLLFFLASIDLNAQLKVGMNPKTLSSNIYLEVESVQGNKFIVTKDSAKVGLGTSSPSTRLEINNGNVPGAIKIIDGTEGVGKVLTSNANGLGTWNTPTVNSTNVTNSKDLSNSNGIIVSGGIGATLQNTSLRLDSAAIAKMINQSPIKDSLLKVINSNTTVGSTFNVSTRVLTTTVNGVTSSVTIPNAVDSTTASNGLNLNGKDVRLGGTLTMPTTITQGSNLMTFTGTPSVGNTGILTLSNTAAGSNGTVLLDMLTPNSDVSYYRIGKSNTTGNSSEITFRTIGNNSDSNSLSFGFYGSQYLVNLTKNGNLGIGTNLFVPTQKLDVDGGARIRNLGVGSSSDSIVTVDGTGVLRRRSLSAVVSGDNWGTQTVAVSAPLTGNGTSGSPLNITRANTTAANNLVTITNGTNATFTAMTVGVDTTNLKSFLNNKIAVNSSAPLSGNGTSSSPLTLATNNTTAGQLVTVTNGTGASLTNMQVGVDTSALKTFVNDRTTVSNTFNSSTRALTTTVNGVTSSVTIPNAVDSTTASNGLTLNGKDVRLGGTLNTATTITQGANVLNFNATPTADYTAGINITNNATGNAGATVLNMISPNSDTAFYRIGKSISTGNVAEISYTHKGTNNDTNRLSFGFHSSRYLLNLMKNGNLSVGNTIATEKLDVDGGARIRSLASGAASDSIVTVDGTGVLRRRSLSAVVSGDNWGTQTVAVSSPLTGNGTSGSPLNITRANTTAANNLVTITNGTNATFTAMTVGVDTTNLKSFLNNKITVSSSAPLSGNGTSSSPLTLATNNTTAGQLVTVTNGTGASLTNMQVSVDTLALKTFVNGRTTNTLTASSNSITNITNGVAATLTPNAGTITTKFLGFDASGNLVTDTALTSSNNI